MRKDKSTSGEAQRRRILEALRLHPRNTYELRRMGCFQAPTRILELRRAGYRIRTSRVVVVDADGYRHGNVALYSLHGEA